MLSGDTLWSIALSHHGSGTGRSSTKPTGASSPTQTSSRWGIVADPAVTLLTPGRGAVVRYNHAGTIKSDLPELDRHTAIEGRAVFGKPLLLP